MGIQPEPISTRAIPTEQFKPGSVPTRLVSIRIYSHANFKQHLFCMESYICTVSVFNKLSIFYDCTLHKEFCFPASIFYWCQSSLLYSRLFKNFVKLNWRNLLKHIYKKKKLKLF